jgi:AAA15 family ATPase/GTPase
MKIIEDLDVENFRNIKHARLENMKDLNILIGPNNCGKTSILELISSFSRLIQGRSYFYLCQECNRLRDKIGGITLPLKPEDFYLKKDPREIKVKLKFSLNPDSINKLVSGRVLEKQREKQKEIVCKNTKNQIEMENPGDYSYNLYGKHFSPFIHNDIIEEVKRSILYCPEGRLQSYQGKGFCRVH